MQDVELENPFDDCHELHDEILNSKTEELPEVFPVVDLASPTCIREIVIHRSNVLKSMISEFSANDVLQSNLIFVFMGDYGKLELGRGAGVTQEVLTLFWRVFNSLGNWSFRKSAFNKA